MMGLVFLGPVLRPHVDAPDPIQDELQIACKELTKFMSGLVSREYLSLVLRM